MKLFYTLLISIAIHALIIGGQNILAVPSSKKMTLNNKLFFTVLPRSGVTQVSAKKEKAEHSSAKKDKMKKRLRNEVKTRENHHSSFSSQTTTDSPINGIQALNIQLSYPIKAVREHLEGTVVVEVMISEGHVTNHQIIQSSGHQELDFAVTQAIQGVSVRDVALKTSTKLDLTFDFRL